jgi:hypothetical protein
MRVRWLGGLGGLSSLRATTPRWPRSLTVMTAEPRPQQIMVGKEAIDRLQRPSRLEDPLSSPEALLAWLRDTYEWKMRDSPTFRTKIKVRRSR